ncbi:PREDICTED: homocysteine S-methyltransferase YbgG-like [Dufourea novaeangliae]|uniref:Homocysteine S-methyltransferase ybgG n=1 Tax=Dufourea novaeangliae TaxID=178035 RepID=A0A154P8H4_DUFNO|nr:PREDICTED: homocysteine S-methyltransferase YbgG-like [Dufourea novaeangliae]KZC08153.1 Homocysteine S-methyltransferase ybgG [Dufourea novaeangliae]
MQAIKVLDGGFSTQLATHVGDVIDGDPLWTARFLATNPKAIISTHLDFLNAGADIILTNTYQASTDGFFKHMSLTEEESLNLFCKAVDYAKEAVHLYKKDRTGEENVVNDNPLIAGSIGPYGACLHDASEYTGKYCSSVSEKILIDWHRPRISKLIDSGIDILAIETIPCKQEAEALVTLLKEFPNIKAWLSFSCRDDGRSIADGSDFQDVAIQCYKKASPGQILAVGVNCIAPQNVSPLFKGINGNCKKEFVPLVVYPNSGEKYTVESGWMKKEKGFTLHQFIDEWLNLGVRYIGGCCRTNVEDIKKIRTEVELWQTKES